MQRPIPILLAAVLAAGLTTPSISEAAAPRPAPALAENTAAVQVENVHYSGQSHRHWQSDHDRGQHYRGYRPYRYPYYAFPPFFFGHPYYYYKAPPRYYRYHRYPQWRRHW